MNEPDEWPQDAAEAATRVACVIDVLDERTEDEEAVLLSELLYAAWPSRISQDQ
jgi:hypothetical protein